MAPFARAGQPALRHDQRRWHSSRKQEKAVSTGHSGLAIETFNGPHKWLSNFSWSALEYEGERYPSVEHAFQAAKLRSNEERRAWGFNSPSLSFGEAKRLGRQVPLREDWKEVRETVMSACLAAKFADPGLRARLLATGDCELIDGHSGSPDLIWGYHIPSQAGENRLGKLLMDLRTTLRQDTPAERPLPDGRPAQGLAAVTPSTIAALFHLDWPMKCLRDGLPTAYAERLCGFAKEGGLAGGLVVLPGRRICVALRGSSAAVDAWERRMRTEHVDVNSRGRPCRERMLVELLRTTMLQAAPDGFDSREALDWQELVLALAGLLGLPLSAAREALGPEPPPLPREVRYVEGRTAVLLDGQRFPLCLNDDTASSAPDLELLGGQQPRGPGVEVPLVADGGRPSIFGGKFARALPSLLDEAECSALIELSERVGYGLAGSRGLNPLARFALRSLVDAPRVASALTGRLAELLPLEYPPGSGQTLLGLNERLRCLKYLPGMHHSGDHTDCPHEDPKRGARSYLTVQLYLNCGFHGGRTTFVSDRLVPVEPSVGGAVVFDHELYHRGGLVTEGTKYAVRMDVLYGLPGKSGCQATPMQQRVGHEQSDRQRAGRWARKN